MARKNCCDCGTPIYTPELGDDESERCCLCIDDGTQFDIDPLEMLKQEAYAAGWEAGVSAGWDAHRDGRAQP